MKRVMSGKVVGQDDIPVVVERGQSTLTRLFNKILENERKPKELKSVLILIFKRRIEGMNLWKELLKLKDQKIVHITLHIGA